MALDNVQNFSRSTLAEDLTSGETDINVADGSQFPDPSVANYNVVIWDAGQFPNPADDSNAEIVRVTAKSSNTLTVTRGQEGTSGVTHSTGDAIANLLTAKMITDIETELAAKLESEVNDLTASVTWANVPDANITESSVTQHEDALSITESQITDLSHFSGNYNDLTNKPDLTTLNDTVVEPTQGDFPATGDDDKVYIAEDTGYMYRWNGSSYTQLTDQTAIWGQISGTLSNQTDLQNALDAKLETIDDISEIDAALRTGSDGTLVTGTAGVSNNLIKYDENGDAIDSGFSADDLINAGSTFYLSSDDSSDIAGYEQLIREPSQNTETIKTANNVQNSDGEVLIEEFVTEPGIPGVSVIKAGAWEFNTYADVASNAGVSTIVIRVYKRDTGGTETELFNVTTPEINDLQRYERVTAQPSFNLDPSDRLVFKYFAQTTSGSDKDFELYLEGGENFSNVLTPTNPVASLGDVSGPASSTNNNLAAFDGTDGRTIKDSGESVSDLLPRDGSRSMTGDFDLGNNDIINSEGFGIGFGEPVNLEPNLTNNLNNIDYTSAVSTFDSVGNSTATTNVNSKDARNAEITLNGNHTIEANMFPSTSLTMFILHNGSTQYTPTFTTDSGDPSIKWIGGQAPSDGPASGEVLVVTLTYSQNDIVGGFDIAS